jgi:hypothetical protein
MFILRIYLVLSPYGEISTTPAPAPVLLFNPSKYIVQDPDMSGAAGICD